MLLAPVHANELMRSTERAELPDGKVNVNARMTHQRTLSRDPHPELLGAPSYGSRTEELAFVCRSRDHEVRQERVLDCIAMGTHASRARQDLWIRRADRIATDHTQLRPHPSEVLLLMPSADNVTPSCFVRKRGLA